MSENYEELVDTGFSAPSQPVPAEKEKFKAIYITGVARHNEESGVDEEVGKLQARGLKYNQDKVHMIITHVKPVLLNQPDRSQPIKCFSYKPSNQEWFGTSGKKCPKNRADRDQVQFCSTCRSVLIIAGVACEEDGTPITTVDEEDGKKKPNFVFTRCYGMKYKPANDYLTEMTQMDIEPAILTHNTDRDKQIEKEVVNNKRYVTEITVSTSSTQYGLVQVFNYQRGEKVPENVVKKILDMAKKSKEDFAEKFDLSRRQSVKQSSGSQVSGYGESNSETFDEIPTKDKENQESNQNESSGSEHSFEDIEF